MTSDEQRDEQLYSLVALRRLTSVELVRQSQSNAHEIVRLRASIELAKRDARRPVNLPPIVSS